MDVFTQLIIECHRTDKKVSQLQDAVKLIKPIKEARKAAKQ